MGPRKQQIRLSKQLAKSYGNNCVGSMLAHVVLAASLVAGAAAQAATWYPTGKDKHSLMTTPSVKISGAIGEVKDLKYKKLYRTGETFGLTPVPDYPPYLSRLSLATCAVAALLPPVCQSNAKQANTDVLSRARLH